MLLRHLLKHGKVSTHHNRKVENSPKTPQIRSLIQQQAHPQNLQTHLYRVKHQKNVLNQLHFRGRFFTWVFVDEGGGVGEDDGDRGVFEEFVVDDGAGDLADVDAQFHDDFAAV